MASISKENVAAKILLEAEAGFVLSPDDPQAVVDLLVRLAQDRSSLQRLGDNARRFAEENFSKQIVLPRLVSLLESAVTLSNRGVYDCITTEGVLEKEKIWTEKD